MIRTATGLARVPMLLVLPLVGAAGASATACAGPSRDVVPETRDLTVGPGVDAGPMQASPDGYVYVAKRSRGLVALAEARGLDDATARAAIDSLADALDACTAKLAAEGKLAKDGAGRVVAAIAEDGHVLGLNVKASPGAQTAQNLLLCVVSPMKLLTFPPAGDAGTGARGMAIEAAWGG